MRVSAWILDVNPNARAALSLEIAPCTHRKCPHRHLFNAPLRGIRTLFNPRILADVVQRFMRLADGIPDSITPGSVNRLRHRTNHLVLAEKRVTYRRDESKKMVWTSNVRVSEQNVRMPHKKLREISRLALGAAQ
jgi:hypothetical protein